MTPAQQKPKFAASVAATDTAPLIFFDGSYAYGALGGMLQIELAATMLVPSEDKIHFRPICTAHLRGSPAAMLQLREAIDKAMAMAGEISSAKGDGDGDGDGWRAKGDESKELIPRSKQEATPCP
jgi:hypothetical protein